MNPRMTLSKPREPGPEPRPSATIIAWPQAGARRFRREAPSEAQPPGQILFFTGVRYERMPEVQAEPPLRQRKRS